MLFICQCSNKNELVQVNWLKNNLIKTDTLFNSRDTSGVKQQFQNIEIIGLGEGTHGTSEFYQIRHTLSEQLIRQLDFNIIALEANYYEGVQLNNYINHGKGNLSAIIDSMLLWCWHSQEFMNSIKWLKSYNDTVPEIKKVKIYGIDIQSRKEEADIVIDYLQEVNAKYPIKVENALNIIKESGFKPVSPEYENIVNEITDTLIKNKNTYISKTTYQAWQETYHCLTLLAYANKYFRDKKERMFLYGEIRDIYMYNNVNYVSEQEGKDSKIIIWAHNKHISKWKNCGQLNLMCYKTMGHYLKNKYKSKYYSLGTIFNQGYFNTVNLDGVLCAHYLEPAPAGSAPDILSKTNINEFFINFMEYKKNEKPVQEFLNNKIYIYTAGSSVEFGTARKISLAESFDGIIFVDKTHATRMIPRKNMKKKKNGDN